MRVVNALTASIVGIGVAAAVASIDLAWPALAIGAGAVVAAGILLVGRRSGQKRYAGAGASYTLGLAGVIYATSWFPEGYAESPLVALAGLGAVSALLVAATEGTALLARVVGGERVEKIVKAVAAVLALLGMVWTVLTAYEKALRYAGVGIGGTTTFALNFLGVEFPIPLWFLSDGVDATIVLFVGSVLIGFHTLDSIHHGWRATKTTAKAGAKAGRTGASAAKSAVSSEEN